MQRELLFRVIDKGHEYRIYKDGFTEGFGEGATVVNYYDLVSAREFQQHARPPQLNSLCPATELGKEQADESQ